MDGFMMESKKEIYDLIPQQYYPKNKLIKKELQKNVVKTVESAAIKYPFIAKPDIGLRGSVIKINTVQDLKEYAEKSKFIIVQDLIPYENEVGIFYALSERKIRKNYRNSI
jgi:hypothetical protein